MPNMCRNMLHASALWLLQLLLHNELIHATAAAAAIACSLLPSSSSLTKVAQDFVIIISFFSSVHCSDADSGDWAELNRN